jgi:hypothetical protein
MAASIEVVLQNGTRNTLRLGRVIDGYPQHNAMFFNTISTPFAITQATRQHIFPSLKDILIIRPLNTNPNDITQLTWQMGADMWHLTRSTTTDTHDQTAVWRFVDPEPGDIDQQQVGTVLQYIANITADDWFETPEPAWDDATRPLIVSLAFPHSRVIQLTLMQRDNSIGLKYSNLPGVFILSEIGYATLLKSLTDLSSARIASTSRLPVQP